MLPQGPFYVLFCRLITNIRTTANGTTRKIRASTSTNENDRLNMSHYILDINVSLCSSPIVTILRFVLTPPYTFEFLFVVHKA